MSLSKSPEHTSNETALIDKRIRHIIAVQVHNLTPFPARDSLASALSQPAEHSQFTSHGHLTDDLDVTMQQKRSRRMSTNSHRSVLSEDGLRNEGSSSRGTLTERGLRTSGSSINFSEATDHRQLALPLTARPHRVRTTSVASSARSYISGPSNTNPSLYSGSTSTYAPQINSIFPGNSQTELEKVIESRLVETFITITIPKSQSSDYQPLSLSPSSPTFRDRDKVNVEGNLARNTTKGPAKTSLLGKALPVARHESVTSPRISPQTPPSHTKSTSISVTRVGGEAKRMPSLYPAVESVQLSHSKHTVSTPHYFSPIHRPSTHPRFAIDINSIYDFAEGIDGSGTRLKIEVWGKVGPGWNNKLSGKGKEKFVDPTTGWRILQERDFDLRDLVPLPASFSVDSSPLPSNSLVITLSHSGGIFFLPPPALPLRCTLSPTDGYATDPEPDTWNARELASVSSVPETLTGHIESPVLISRRRQNTSGFVSPPSSQNDAPATTAGWQDILKLVTLQSCILDNKSSLLRVERGIDKMLGRDNILFQHREICEYEARLEELAANHKKVIEDSKNLRSQIQVQMKNLHQRKQMLRSAKEQLEKDVESEVDLKNEVLRQQAQQSALRARFGPTRTTLISILFSIYPIELLSPPDLLYTILDVPLPIPFALSDPAPPLTLPSHKDVTEDAIATALGYAAQVVQLLSGYLGKSLVYPVTCIGSRSLIRDNISAMVGPRMFPLYSKGVDTYRYEYGVFLLNKDIELLMADRDLRALDMRHTLPNLKNLLLTLTDGERALLVQSKPSDSPLSLASELELVSRPESPVDLNSVTPKVSHTAILEGSTPSASRSSTPTAAADPSKKPRSFIAFSPLTDFLRGRYPSSSRISMESKPDTVEPQDAESSATTSVSENSSDDEDRKTISGTSCGAGGGREFDFPPGDSQAKKFCDGSHSPVHSTPPLPVTPTVRLTPGPGLSVSTTQAIRTQRSLDVKQAPSNPVHQPLLLHADDHHLSNTYVLSHMQNQNHANVWAIHATEQHFRRD